MAHPPITGKEQSEQAQTILTGRSKGTAHKAHRPPRPYALRGVLPGGLCDGRMTGNWDNDQANYRCRYPPDTARPTTWITPRPSTCAKLT